MPPDQVSSLVEALDEAIVDTITPQLVGSRPNTYTFTKALAESWMEANHGDIPVAIVRPSIVLSSINEPLTGEFNKLLLYIYYRMSEYLLYISGSKLYFEDYNWKSQLL